MLGLLKEQGDREIIEIHFNSKADASKVLFLLKKQDSECQAKRRHSRAKKKKAATVTE